MTFGIPSEDFHGGFGLPHKAVDCDGRCLNCDSYNHISGCNAEDYTDEEMEEAAEEAYDNLVRSLIEAGGEIRELRELLKRALEQLILLGYNSGFTNEEVKKLVDDITKYFWEIK